MVEPWLRRTARDLRAALVLARSSVMAMSGSGRQVVMRTVGSGSIVGAEVAAVLILVDRFGDLGGWTGPEVAWLFGVANAGLGLGMLLGDALEPPAFSNLIREGRIDLALTRPMSPLLWIIANDVQIRELGRAAAGLAVVVWATLAAGVTVTPLTSLLVLLAVSATASIVFSILVMAAAVTVYTVEGSELANAFTYGGAALTGYPMQIYSSALRAVFLFVIPLGLAVYVPSLTVLDREGPAGVGADLVLLTPVATVAFAVLAALAWRRGLRHYEGTGS